MASLHDLIVRLQKEQGDRAGAGIAATLACDPPVVVGRAAFTVHARVYASTAVLGTLAPIVRCAERADFPDRAMRGRAPGTYTARIAAAHVAVDTTYRLTLHPRADLPAIATCTLHTFSDRVVAAARRELRNLVPGAPVSSAAAARPHRGSRPQRARATRRRRAR